MPVKKTTPGNVMKRGKHSFLVNVTRKKELAAQGKVLRGLATGIGAMFFGLRGSLVLVWWKEGTIAITNWFVPCDLDIVWVNKKGIVVDVHERFAAGAYRTVNKIPAHYVIELPAGTVQATGTKIGDVMACSELVFTRV